MTLQELIIKHPEWANIPMVVYVSGYYSFVGANCLIYENETTDDPDADMDDPSTKKYKVLVFAPS